MATHATLELNDSFKKNYSREFQEWVRQEAHGISRFSHLELIVSQLPDLIFKVIVCSNFYSPKETNLFAALTNLASRSKVVSAIAMPAIKAATQVPVPSALMRVIALSPVIAKLFHIAFLYAHSLHKGPYLKTAKDVAHACANVFEFSFFLRASLLHLSQAKVLYQAVLMTTFWLYTDRFFSTFQLSFEQTPQIFLLFIWWFASPQSMSGLYYTLPGMLSSISASSNPCDLDILYQLYEEAHKSFTFENVTPGQDAPTLSEENLKEKLTRLKEEIDAKKLNIANALRSGDINTSFATSLNGIVERAVLSTLSSQMMKVTSLYGKRKIDEINTISHTFVGAFRALFLAIYFPQLKNEDSQSRVINKLSSIQLLQIIPTYIPNELTDPTSNWINENMGENLKRTFNDLSQKDITDEQLKALQLCLLDAVKYGFLKALEDNPSLSSHAQATLNTLKELYPNETDSLHDLEEKLQALQQRQ